MGETESLNTQFVLIQTIELCLDLKKKNVLTWLAQWLLDIWIQGHRHQILDLQLLANKETKRTYELKGNNCIEKQKSHLTYYVTSALCY